MTYVDVSAAWCSSAIKASDSLCLNIAQGKPFALIQAHHLSEVQAAVQKAHEAALHGHVVVGGLAYEAAGAFDAALHTCPACGPLALFHVYSSSQVQAVPVSQLHGELDLANFQPWLDGNDFEHYQRQFNNIREEIEQGEYYQINLTTRLRSQYKNKAGFDSWALFLTLFQAQPARHSVYLKSQEIELISLSPELFFSWTGNQLTTSPMKGTRKPDSASLFKLGDSEKDRAENVMIVDLLRNDLARVCKPRSVQVRSLFDVVSLPTVEQMTSTICGTTTAGASLVDVFAALFPCGSITGAPKAQAMKKIVQWEAQARGFYCGALGVILPGGDAHFNVPIRTVCAIEKDEVFELEYGVGSGITWYSSCEDEKREWWQKTEFLRSNTCDFQVLETVLLSEGQWQRLPLHLARMRQAANYFSYVFNAQQVLEQLQQIAVDYPRGNWRGRWLLQAQGDFSIEVFDAPQTPAQVVVQLAQRPMKGLHPFIAHKTTYRPHYTEFESAVSAPVFDVLLYTESGMLTEGCRFNLIIDLKEGRFTPKMHHLEHANLLNGVYRQQLLRENKIIEADLTAQDLRNAGAVWLVNSLRQWVCVGQVLDTDGNPVFFRQVTSDSR